jgi:hypothetical protein
LCGGKAEQLALVRLGVANVRWVCAAPRLATHRKQMPIAANVFGVYLRFLANPQFAMKNGFFVFKAEGLENN